MQHNVTEHLLEHTSSILKRISILRLLLIAGVVVVHVPFNDSTSPYNHGVSLFNWARVFFGDVIFRSAVPCLSVISGYLVFRHGHHKPYSVLVLTKLITLVLPFLIWNTGLFVLVFVAQQYGIANGYFPDIKSLPTSYSLDLLFSYSARPINLPLYFVRDLFVCMLLAPIIKWSVLKAPFATLAVLFVMTMLPCNWYLLLRIDILFAFVVGATLSLHRLNMCSLDRFSGILILLFLVVSAAFAYILMVSVDQEARLLVIERKLLNIIGIVCIWSFGSRIASKPYGEFLARHSRVSFWLFCTHYPMLIVCWMVWNKYAALTYYPIFYFGSMLVTVLCLVSFYAIGERLFPRTMMKLSGKRSSM